MDFQSRKFHSVYPLRVVLVGGAGVVFQHAPQAVPLGGGYGFPQLRRAFDLQPVRLGLCREACRRVRVTVGVGDVGLDVVDGAVLTVTGITRR